MPSSACRSLLAAFGLFLLVGGFWLAGLISLVLALPFFGVMRIVENIAEPDDDEEGGEA